MSFFLLKSTSKNRYFFFKNIIKNNRFILFLLKEKPKIRKLKRIIKTDNDVKV